MHQRQALVLANNGGGNGNNIRRLAATIQDLVEAKYGIRLSPGLSFVVASTRQNNFTCADFITVINPENVLSATQLVHIECCPILVPITLGLNLFAINCE